VDTGTVNQTAPFPHDWEAPLDEPGPFFFDPMHFPNPLTPLTASTLGPVFEVGYTTAAKEQQTPVQDFQVRHRNHYRFERPVMIEPANDEDARRLGEIAEAAAKLEIGRMLDRWYSEHLPQVSNHLERLRALDPGNAPASDVVMMLDEADTIHRDLWTIHFRVAIPMLLALQLFDELHADLFGGEAADAHALLVGNLSESVKAGFGLSDLAVKARELGLAEIMRETPSRLLLPALQESETGRALLASLDEYLREYGLRQDLFEYATPTWQEDPTFALSSIRNYLITPRDSRAEHEALSRSAEAALQDARERLSVYPEAVREQFEAMLQFARQASFLQEEHNFYIDQQGLSLLRLFYLRAGDRLAAAGLLAAPDDVFMLTGDELRHVVARERDAGVMERVRALVDARRAEMEIARGLTPPPFIGEPPAGPPAEDPMMRAMGRFFGGPPQQADAPNQIKGNAGSRGVATGIARVARTLEEATSVLPGEILVAVTTMPAWTPLFGVAAAVVTETGGPLSHCAIVAREYGIPAVVGAHGATRTIATGQRITVDGGLGIVTIDA
jgi:pyruvate,water dikinase